jgi:predicted nuclease with TOPRIM domain
MKKEDIIIPVSSGELIDKISILKIKKKKISNKSKLKNINNELSLLNEIYKRNLKKNKRILLYEKKLIKINKKLWDIEDKIRFLESKKNFNQQFTDLARAVYINNDERSEIKKKINKLTGSFLIEEKSYKSY